MKLDAYMDRHGISDPEFAAKIGRDRTTVYRLRVGKTKPDWETLRLIARATSNAVTPSDFLPSPQDQRDEANR